MDLKVPACSPDLNPIEIWQHSEGLYWRAVVYRQRCALGRYSECRKAWSARTNTMRFAK